MTDYSPAGFDAREALARAAVAAVEAATPVDDREAAASDAFLERTRLEVELEEAGVSRSRMSVLWSPLHEIRGRLRPDADRGRGGRRRRSRARLAAVPAALEGLRVTLSDEARKGHVVAARQYAEVAEQVRRWTGQTGEAGDFYLGLVERLEGGDRRPSCARSPAPRAPPPRRSASSSATSSSRRARTRRASAARSTPSPAATSSAPRSTSTRPTPGAGPSCSGSPT